MKLFGKKIFTSFILVFFLITLFIIFIFTYSIYRSRANVSGLNINLRLQGDYSKVKNMTLNSKLQILSLSKETILNKYPIYQKENNIFQLDISLPNYSNNEPVSIFIKPEKYFGRFFPNLAINNSQYSYNFSDKVFYAGDINPVDGRISASDISLIFSKLGQQVNSQMEKADLNNDSFVDTQDYMMALISLKNLVNDEKIISPTPLPTPTSIPTNTPPPILTLPPSPTPTLRPTPTSTSPSQPTNTPTPTPTSTSPSQPTNTPTPTPTSTSPSPSLCQNMENGLQNANLHYPNGSTNIPATTKEICSIRTGNYISIPYRNPNCPVTESGIRKAYERMRTFYPTYFPNTKLLTDWEKVVNYSKKYNFNPLFVIALWIEESAAGGANQAQQLGCLYRLNKDDTFTFLPPSSTICEQMECLFGRRSVIPENFALWACQYQHGSSNWQNNQCTQVTSFTKTIEFWYNYIGENLSSQCQIKHYSPADDRCY